MRGTHRGDFVGITPTNQVLEITGVDIDKVVDGRIVEHGFSRTAFASFNTLSASTASWVSSGLGGCSRSARRRVIEAGRAVTPEQALEAVKADLKPLNSSVEVSQEEHDEVVAVKAMFLNEDYR